MDAPAFTTTAALPTHAVAVGSATCGFAPRAGSSSPATAPARRGARMMAGQESEHVKKSEATGYVIKQSEFVDGGEEDDMGDGFMGESEMDDMLGVAMPDDLAGFEKDAIMKAKTRDELVSKLRDIKMRRKDILVDRRKGMGMDNVGNYLNQL